MHDSTPASNPSSPLSELRLQPRYSETDAMGVVYYANYLVYFEVARTTALADLGHPYWEMEKQGFLIPVLQAHCAYQSPARYGDNLIVRTHRARLGRARIRFDYVVLRENGPGDETPLATGFTEHGFVTPAGRPLRPPEALIALFPESNDIEK